MKSLAEQMRNHDREQMSRMAHNLPEQYQERAPVEQVAQVFNKLFNELRAAFPASMANFRSQDDLNEFRRQWLLAFQENGIHSMAQVDAGMRIARRQERPFLPSPGQFVAWCKAGEAAQAGLPTADELVDMIYQYCRTRGLYPDAESYPWQTNAHYWLVTSLYQNMRANSLSDSELRRKAEVELAQMANRINRGERIPEPVKALPVLGGKPLTQAQGLSKIAEIRARHGLKGKGKN